MQLPPDFTRYTSALFGPERWARYRASFEHAPDACVRFNPWKTGPNRLFAGATPVPWCQQAYWLKDRPNFTLDPLFHAGVYYVQEAGSLFLEHVLRTYVKTPVLALDLCGAPGGKATLMRAALPAGSMLVANEPERKRANILLENMLKQGHPDVLVTHNYPADFQKTNWTFDVILTDVPCSGEGLFRREPDAVNEWSLDNVAFCQKRQREILRAIWPCLRAGGLLIYSTCTFNTRENEENVRFIADELGAEILPVPVAPEWNITGSLLAGWERPVYRFISGITRSEGLFMAVLRKTGGPEIGMRPDAARKHARAHRLIHLLSDGTAQPEQKGKAVIPSIAQALAIENAGQNFPPTEHGLAAKNAGQIFPRVELDLTDALRYLHRESLTLPAGTPAGFAVVTYRGIALGFVKNVGERANNLYPKNWAIKKL